MGLLNMIHKKLGRVRVSFIILQSSLSEDFARYYPHRGFSFLKLFRAILFHPGLLAVFIMRIQIFFFDTGNYRLAGLARSINCAITGADFVMGCQIGPGLQIVHPVGVVVGYSAIIGKSCTLMQQTTLGQLNIDGGPAAPNPTLGDGVIVSAGAKILGGVNIGENSVIGANSVVLKDVPAGCTAVGVPAKILRR